MKNGYSFARDEIQELFDLQKKWEMSDSLLAYLDTYFFVCCQNPMIRTRRFFKIIVVGDTGFDLHSIVVLHCRSGKTSLLMRYVNGVFSPNYQATIGASVLSKVVNEESELQVGVYYGLFPFSYGILQDRSGFRVLERVSIEVLIHVCWCLIYATARPSRIWEFGRANFCSKRSLPSGATRRSCWSAPNATARRTATSPETRCCRGVSRTRFPPRTTLR